MRKRLRLLGAPIIVPSVVLAVALSGTIASSVRADITISRGASLAVDAAKDGRIAIDLRGDVWIVPGGGGTAVPITQNLRSAQRPRWSPDTKQLAYQATIDGLAGIWIYNLTSGDTTKIGNDSHVDLSSAKSSARHPAWHPDGERIVFSSDRLGAGFDLWEVDLATGLQWRLSELPGDETEPAWSADGDDLVYVSYDRQRSSRQWSLRLRRQGHPDETLFSSSLRIAAPSWRPDGTLITFFQVGANSASLNNISLDIVILSEPRLLRTYAANENFVITPVSWLDRQRMVYSADGEIRQRQFDDRRSRPIEFRATIIPEPVENSGRLRPEFRWLDEPQGELIIHATRLFDGISSGYQYEKDIVIHGGRVTAVEEHSERPGKIVIDMGDLTIIPGIIDADARLPDKLSASHGPDLLTMGITTVVGAHANAGRLNTLWSGKDVPGPRLLDTAQWSVGTLLRPDLDVTAAVVGSRSTGLTTGMALAMEYHAMRRAGLTPEQTLRAVGVNAAAALLADPYIGRIATGAAADMVFVNGDPLEAIEAALNVVAVVRNGRFYSVSGLIDRAKSAEAAETVE